MSGYPYRRFFLEDLLLAEEAMLRCGDLAPKVVLARLMSGPLLRVAGNPGPVPQAAVSVAPAVALVAARVRVVGPASAFVGRSRWRTLAGAVRVS
jgi:hypothetical protein